MCSLQWRIKYPPYTANHTHQLGVSGKAGKESDSELLVVADTSSWLVSAEQSIDKGETDGIKHLFPLLLAQFPCFHSLSYLKMMHSFTP